MYNTVTIGTQVWMKENLKVSHYTNGDPIPEVKDSLAWLIQTKGAWCNNENKPANGIVYGKLYNWHAANDLRGIAPKGWHVPSDAEWKTLEMYVGMLASTTNLENYRGTKEANALKKRILPPIGLWRVAQLRGFLKIREQIQADLLHSVPDIASILMPEDLIHRFKNLQAMPNFGLLLHRMTLLHG